MLGPEKNKKETIKVFHLIHWPVSGIVNLVHNQIKNSSNDNIEYLVGFLKSEEKTDLKFEKLNIVVLGYKYLFFNLPYVVLKIFSDIKKHKPDIIHTHSFLPGVIIRTLSFFLKVKIISTFHNTYPYLQKKSLKDRIKTSLEIKTIEYIDHKVITVSNYVAQHLRENTNIDASIKTIYTAIDTTSVYNNQNRISSNYVISVGRLDIEKRYDRLLRIWKKVVEEKSDVQLFIVGEGNERGKLEKLAYDLRINDSVKFLGFRTDVLELMSNSQFSVLASDHEGFPLVVLESYLQKKPVIAFDIGPLKEIIDDNNGLLIEKFNEDRFAKGIVFLLNNEKLAIQLGLSGHQKIMKHFDIKAMIAQIEDEYLSLTG